MSFFCLYLSFLPLAAPYLLHDDTDSEDSFTSDSDSVPAVKLKTKPPSQSEGEEAKPTSSTVEEDQKQKEQLLKLTVSKSGEISTNAEGVATSQG